MKLLRRRRSAADQPVDHTVEADLAAELRAGAKGRPTPKRRDTGPKRGPVAPAPKTRKEAMRWQRQHAKQARATGATLTPQERRARLMAGDPAHLPRRDAGPVRALARDWVDSRRMLANLLLLLFPLVALSLVIKFVNYVVIALFLAGVVEGLLAGRQIMSLARARARGLETKENGAAIGFYALQRAYLPRRWRIPRPQVERGAEI